jgi:hypothetical protein
MLNALNAIHHIATGAAVKVIYKYKLELLDDQTLMLPTGSIVLHFHEQNGNLCVWARHDPTAGGTETHRFYIVGTGNLTNEFEPPTDYIGSAHVGEFVWHVFHWVSPALKGNK